MLLTTLFDHEGPTQTNLAHRFMTAGHERSGFAASLSHAEVHSTFGVCRNLGENSVEWKFLRKR